MFKVGDIVKCVNNCRRENLTLGKNYCVLYTTKSGVVIGISDDAGEVKRYFPERFQIAEPKYQKSNVCQHKWKATLGLMRTYYDCELCGIKQEEA